MTAPRSLDVIAIGNAIVDVLAHADDGFVAEHGLRKGTMGLVDQARAERLYAALGPAIEVSGGSAANTAVGVASLGGTAGFIGRVRDDQLGRIFAHDIRAAGVDYQMSPAPADASGPPTARSMIVVTPDAQRTMSTYLGVASEIPAQEVDEEWVAAAQVLYVEGYLLGIPASAEAVGRAVDASHRAGRLVALSLSDPTWVELQRPAFAEFLPSVDVLLGNEEEVLAVSRESTLTDAINALRCHCAVVAVTRGAEGSVVIAHEGVPVAVPAYPVANIVDTTGAGDLYAAGFLFGLTRGRAMDECARLGSLAASEIIAHLGPRPETSLRELASVAGF
jgi:sugar/nucleoside kinase (ribokinase family)